jgi:hypothetical protein
VALRRTYTEAMRWGVIAVLAALLAAGVSACSAREPGTLEVPGDYDSIQAAVDHAVPGDLILIAPGTYQEAVEVDVDDITIRGLDRNEVVLDGGHDLRSGIVVRADGVSVENLTVHSYRLNGVIFTGSGELGHFEDDYRNLPELDENGTVPHLERFRIAYVTSYNNGLYGLYAFQSRNGVIEQSYASGHPDSGLYVGQCSPCNTVVDGVTMENNAIGYEGTNATGDVYIVRSVFRGNRLGVTPNSQTQELLSPQRETYVVGNLVVDNDNPDTPPIARGFFGGGIAIGGGEADYVARNRVSGHDAFGIGVISLNPFEPESNIVEGNVLSDNRVDLVYSPSASVTTSLGNCFAANDFASSIPASVEDLMPCPGVDGPVALEDLLLPRAPKGVDYRDMKAPPAQPGMPGDLRARPAPLPSQPTFPDLASIGVPDA